MKKNGEKIFWGVFFILGAVFLLVSKMGYLQGISVLTLFLAVLFAACLIKSIIHVKFAGILFSLAFLAILFDEPLGIEAITPWPVLGAALLGSIGLNLLFKGKWNCKWNSGEFPRHAKDAVDVESEVIGEDANYMKYETTFGDSIKYVNSDDFKRLDLECTFGGMKVYFDNAIIQGGSAVVELKVAFAGIELYVPKSWQVVNHTSAAFGGVHEKNHPQTTGTPTLVLNGSLSFGGVEIFYV